MSTTSRSKKAKKPVRKILRKTVVPKKAATQKPEPKKAVTKPADPTEFVPAKPEPKQPATKKPAPKKAAKYDKVPPKVEPQPKKAKRAALPIAVRREIRRMLNDKVPMSQILLKFKKYGLIKDDVYRVRAGRVKLDYTPRVDKGHKYGARTLPEREGIAAPTDSGLTVQQLIDDAIKTTMEDLRIKISIDPIERGATVERIQRVRRHQQALSITGHLKDADAMLIAQIVRRFKPDATDEEIVLIYRESKAVVAAELKNDA
jgi:hypothetical protein